MSGLNSIYEKAFKKQKKGDLLRATRADAAPPTTRRKAGRNASTPRPISLSRVTGPAYRAFLVRNPYSRSDDDVIEMSLPWIHMMNAPRVGRKHGRKKNTPGRSQR